MLSKSIIGILKVIRDSGTLPTGGTDAAKTLVLPLTRPNGTVNQTIYQNVNLLTDKPEIGRHYMAGLASFALSASWKVANVFIRKVEKQLLDGTWGVVFEDTVGVEATDAVFLAFLMEDMPLDGSESFRYTLFNSTGGAIDGSILGRYVIGLPEDAKLATGI